MVKLRKDLSAGRLALVGVGVLMLALALAAVAGALFPSQDPGGQAMAAGAVFLVGAVLGFGGILAAIVRCFRRSC